MENFPARAPRLIASDIDGTLLDRNHRVPIRNREAVARGHAQQIGVGIEHRAGRLGRQIGLVAAAAALWLWMAELGFAAGLVAMLCTWMLAAMLLPALAALAALLWFADGRIDWIALQAHSWLRVAWLAGVLAASGVVYFGVLLLFGFRPRDFGRRRAS